MDVAITTRTPSGPAGGPPVVLVHGAANSAAVWTYWHGEITARGHASHAIDLRGHGRSEPCDLSDTSMDDYADDVTDVLGALGEPAIVMGWSMGGLVAMMAAARRPAVACIGLAPSTPAAARDPAKKLQAGEFDASEYGINSRDPVLQPAMPDLDQEEREIALTSLCRDSRLARGERAAGVVVERLDCPLLVVTGTEDRQWPRTRYTDMPLAANYLEIHGASHWGLVLNRRLLPEIAASVFEWLAKAGV